MNHKKELLRGLWAHSFKYEPRPPSKSADLKSQLCCSIESKAKPSSSVGLPVVPKTSMPEF